MSATDVGRGFPPVHTSLNAATASDGISSSFTPISDSFCGICMLKESFFTAFTAAFTPSASVIPSVLTPIALAMLMYFEAAGESALYLSLIHI